MKEETEKEESKSSQESSEQEEENLSQESSKPTTIASALSNAETIIASAESKAEAIIEQAKLDAKGVREKAFEEGLEKGKEEVADAAINLIEDNSKLEEELSAKAVKLALSICSTIISEQVKIEPSIVTKIAQKALESSIIGQSATIVVNPADSKTLKEASPDLEKIIGDAKFSVETSKLISPGGCIIKTDYGEVDATIETLVSQIATRLGVS